MRCCCLVRGVVAAFARSAWAPRPARGMDCDYALQAEAVRGTIFADSASLRMQLNLLRASGSVVGGRRLSTSALNTFCDARIAVAKVEVSQTYLQPRPYFGPHVLQPSRPRGSLTTG